MTTTTLYPLFLRLAGRSVLVVGGGSVGTRKAVELVAAGAKTRVVAPTVSDELARLAADGGVDLVRRTFDASDVEGTWLVIAATNDSVVNAEVAAAAEARRVFVNAVDDPPNASAFFASRIARGPFTIAISSSGTAPALSRLIREILESVLPEAGWLEAAEALRDRWRRTGTPMSERFGELVRDFAARVPPR